MKLPRLAALLIAAAPMIALADDAVVRTVLDRIRAQDIEAHVRTLAAFGTRHTMSETASDTRGIGAARRWIKRELEACNAARKGRLKVRFQSHVEPAGRRIDKATEIVNVVATLPGLDPAARARIFVVSGHYDSRASDVMDARSDAPGANDDASGTAAVMAMACAMADQPTDATLVFLAVAGEEQGLLGADRFARDAAAAGERIEGMITNDIIGSPLGDDGVRREQTVRLFADGLTPMIKRVLADQRNQPGEDKFALAAREALTRIALTGGEHDTPTHQFARAIKRSAERWQPDFTVQLVARRDRFLRGGDHLPFLERGFAAVRFTEPVEDFRHQHQDLRTEGDHAFGDLPEYVDFEYVARVTRANAAALTSLARAPAAPQQVVMDTAALSNDTALSWAANTEADLAGYRVVWRETTSAVWQAQREVGRDTRVTLKGLSKDNYQFGVIAVDRDGNESIASFAGVAR
ncbi:M28 family metallopeptidase [Niveibacterium sp. 24ML]|uniref:M28 family metallopeptidase n=1 Tax=Niveibacterium sp. 24ML TaxID=2985512 RepID=UPI00226E0A45|nr:M28 family metallopeptidase [Niveibacterium sp. 24ML]MCX9155726.1 M28 family metallopeptidase [Niveibacterium sp. 24ML]